MLLCFKQPFGSPRHNDEVKSRTIGLLLVCLVCLPLLVLHANGGDLLKDSDTAFLIMKLNQYHDPIRWFFHDWPLENHFYRPISTLFFEFDNHFFPGNGSAFGFTNAAICALATFALYWFLVELKRSIPIAVFGAWLFSFWTLGGWFLGFWLPDVISYLPWLGLIAITIRTLISKQFSWSSLLVALAGFFVWNQLTFIQPKLSAQTLYWLPGRTATSMTIFVLIALASYVRFERLGAANRPAPQSSPLDPPATRTSNQDPEPKNVWGWFALSLVSTALAMAAYEQAVMVPAMIFFAGAWLRVSGKQTRFGLQVFFWGILVAYIVYRVQIIPPTASGYQKQQFRMGEGLWLDILNYIYPGFLGLRVSLGSAASGLLILMTDSFWGPFGSFVSNTSTWIAIRKSWKKPAIALALAVFAYLPMAFLKQFGHYHYLPAAMLTLYVISLFEAYWPALVRAVSPPALQAPARMDRAPGSLPQAG